MANILIVDDEQGIRDLLFDILDDEGHSVAVAENAEQARAHRAKTSPDLVLLDIWMPDTDGVSLLKEWSSNALLTMPVIMMSGHATIETAVAATKLGALSFLEKPITLQKLMAAVDQGLKHAEKLAAKTLVYGARTKLGSSDQRTNASPAISPLINASPSGANHSQETMASAQTDERMPLKPDYLIRLDQPLRDAKDEFDKAYFAYHLQTEQGSVAQVAQKTGLERTHLYRKLKQLGFDPVKVR